MTDPVREAVERLKQRHPSMGVDELVSATPRSVDEIFEDVNRCRPQIVACVVWLGERPPRKTFNRREDTYGLKHEVERVVGSWVSHTAFLVAVEMLRIDMVLNNDRRWAAHIKR